MTYTATQKAIEDFRELHQAVSLEKKELPFRPHLGLSGIGAECHRKIWLDFRWATRKKVPANVVGLFDRGHSEEPRFVEALRAIGVTVQDVHPETGKQFKCSYANGHVGGSTDGFGVNFPDYADYWALLEFKTHSLKSFEDMCKKGVQLSKPVHYAQVQTYMKSFGVKRCLYMAVCKNDDRLYTEWIDVDEDYAQEKIDLAVDIVYNPAVPDRIALASSDYRCRTCDHRPVCWNKAGSEPDRNCRTCVHSYPNQVGTWGCKFNGVQEDLDCYNPCSAYEKHEVFIPLKDVTMSLTMG